MSNVLSDKKASSSQSATPGAPEGYILSPILFLLYINDTVYANPFLKFILYADDGNICASGPQFIIIIIITMANHELVKTQKWLLCKEWTLNTEKWHFDFFNRNKVIPNELPQLKIGPYGTNRETSANCLNLLHIDEKITMKDQIYKI